MFALSATFQAKVGDYDAAFARIFYEGVPGGDLAAAEDTEAPADDQPFASIWPFNTGFRALAADYLRPYGQLHVYLMTPRHVAQTDWNNRRLEAIDFLEGWVTDVANLSLDTEGLISGEGLLAISSIETPMHQHIPKELEATVGDFYYRHMTIGFGQGDGGGA